MNKTILAVVGGLVTLTIGAIVKQATKYDKNGFDKNGFDKEGFDREGFNEKGCNREGYKREDFDKDGYNKKGFDSLGYSRNGHHISEYDSDYFDKEGYNPFGYDKKGFNKEGITKEGFRREDFDIDGYNEQGFDSLGYSKNYRIKAYDGYYGGYVEKHYHFSEYDSYGFNKEGYNPFGYDKEGFDYLGFNKEGYSREGYKKSDYEYIFDDECGHDYYEAEYDNGCYIQMRYFRYGYSPFGYDRALKNREFYSKEISKLREKFNKVEAQINIKECGSALYDIRLIFEETIRLIVSHCYGEYDANRIVNLNECENLFDNDTFSKLYAVRRICKKNIYKFENAEQLDNNIIHFTIEQEKIILDRAEEILRLFENTKQIDKRTIHSMKIRHTVIDLTRQ